MRSRKGVFMMEKTFLDKCKEDFKNVLVFINLNQRIKYTFYLVFSFLPLITIFLDFLLLNSNFYYILINFPYLLIGFFIFNIIVMIFFLIKIIFTSSKKPNKFEVKN